MSANQSRAVSNFFCSLCKVNLSDENMLQIHLGTVQHQTMLREQNQQQQQKQQQFRGGGGPSYASQYQKAAAEPAAGPPAGGVAAQHVCELCDSKCTSEETFQMHLRGAKHSKKVKEAEFLRKKEAKDPAVHCSLCGLTMQPELMQTHLNGMKHLAALKAAGDPDAAALIQMKKTKVAEVKALQSVKKEGTGSLAQMMPPDANYEQALSKMPKDELQKLLGKRHHMKCSVCDVPDFTTFSQAEHHFNSKAHRQTYQQRQLEMIKSKGKVCSVCNVTVSSDELLEAHVKGYRHTLRLNGGQIPPGHVYYEKYVKHQETMKNLRANKSASAASSGMDAV